MVLYWIECLRTNLKVKRGKMGWSQQELATKCGLSLNTITRIEQGISGDLRFSTVEAIGKGLKINNPLKLLSKKVIS